MFSRFEHFVRRHLNKWVFRLHGAESGEVFLHQRRVFIVPTHPGLIFCVMLLALFIGSVNYSLSLGFGFTFLIAACALVDMHLTFRNLAHLHLRAGRAAPVFAGEEARFELQLINRRRHDRYAIWLDFIGDGGNEVEHAVDVAADDTTSVTLSAPARRRGWLQAPRVRLQTRFPLGLLRAWAYWEPDARALVYPQPEQDPPPLPLQASDRDNGQPQAGEEDFAGIRNYHPGDSPRRLAWRQIARLDGDGSGPLVAKHFEGGTATEIVFDFARLPYTLDVETRLSRMTSWVIEAEARGLPYAFRLGDIRYPAALGTAHRDACLRALALHGAHE